MIRINEVNLFFFLLVCQRQYLELVEEEEEDDEQREESWMNPADERTDTAGEWTTHTGSVSDTHKKNINKKIPPKNNKKLASWERYQRFTQEGIGRSFWSQSTLYWQGALVCV